MNRLFLALTAICCGMAGFVLFHHQAGKASVTTALIVRHWQSATNGLGATQKAISSLRAAIQDQRNRLREANRYPKISPEMLALLAGNKSGDHARAWAELRQQLGIGWDASPDYVLVNKQAIRDLWFNKLLGDGTLSDDSVKLLSLSPDEAKAVKAALAAACAGQWLNVQSTPPGGDIVAQYTITPPDPAFVAGQSNAFAADITAAIGDERAGFFLKDAWRELSGDLAPTETKTMTIRQTNVDGQPDLVCEVTEGANVSTMPVRYANYPNFPVMKLFPGGWKTLAQTAGFDLPPSFHPPSSP